MKAKDVCSNTFYFCLHFLTFSMLFSLNDNFFNTFSILYQINLFIFAIVSYILLLIAKRNPGIITADNISKQLDNNNISEENNKLKNTEKESLILIKKNCDKCLIKNLPLRSHHCSRCGICIRKFDHHCPMIGGCVGEDNHFKFIVYLFSQLIDLLLSIYGLMKTVSENLNKNKEKYSKIPVSIYFIIGFLLFYLVFVFFLFFFHIYLIITNQTTFEIFHKNKCEYLQTFHQQKIAYFDSNNIDYPFTVIFHPFDLGFKDNVLSLFKQMYFFI